MSIQVELPELGESVVEGEVARWLVKEGDYVEVDQPIVEVTTDKVDAEIPAPAAGVIVAILVPVGEIVEVGAALATLEPGEAASAAPDAAAKPAREAKAAPRSGRRSEPRPEAAPDASVSASSSRSVARHDRQLPRNSPGSPRGGARGHGRGRVTESRRLRTGAGSKQPVGHTWRSQWPSWAGPHRDHGRGQRQADDGPGSAPPQSCRRRSGPRRRPRTAPQAAQPPRPSAGSESAGAGRA